MKKFVLDTSFVATALLKPKSPVAKELEILLKQARDKQVLLFAPYFFVNEFISAVRFSKQNKEKIIALIEKTFSLYIEFKTHSIEQLKQIVKLSFKYNVSVYDASYHILAIQLDATFLTADKKYFNKAKDLGNIKLIS